MTMSWFCKGTSGVSSMVLRVLEHPPALRGHARNSWQSSTGYA